MDEVYKELEELKTELERLKEDYRFKTELSEDLRKAHLDQLAKNQEAKLQIENQSKKLNEKSEELAEIRQLYGEAKSKIHDLESSLKQVSSMSDKIRNDTSEKVQKLEVENKKLVLDCEEVRERNAGLERKLSICNEEIEGLKILLMESQKKCLEAEGKAREKRELKHREEVISKLEEESTSVQDQLKWKKEQFGHLEEAHRKLQDLFESSKKEWTFEKTSMLEEIAGLQSKLDSQTRITKGLESKLEMCNQALAHEESRRKGLEAQLLESKRCFDNVLAEYEEAKAQIESFSIKRDEDIANLRNSLGMKEVLLKEMEYKVTHLEEDNKELLGSLKELREAQINKRKVDPSLNKIRNKLKDLEQVHGNCSQAWKEREAEWIMKMEKLMGDLKCYESDLKRKTQDMNQLKMQLDECHSELEVSGEETSLLLVMMKSELSDAYSKLFKSGDQIEALNKGIKKENAFVLMTQKLDSVKLLEERSASLEGALMEHKKMLEESTDCQLRLKEQVNEMEIALKNLSTSLEKSNSELATKITEATQIKTELYIWKSKAESFKTCLEQVQEVSKQMQTSLLEHVQIEQSLTKENESLKCTINEKEQQIDDLQKKISSLDQKLMDKEAAGEMRLGMVEANKRAEKLRETLDEKEQKIDNLLKKVSSLDQKVMENEAAGYEMRLGIVEANKRAEEFHETLKERDSIVENLQRKIEAMEEQSEIREAAFELEKEELYKKVTEQKDQEIRGIQNSAFSLERDLMDAVILLFSQGFENLVEKLALEDALGRSELFMERKNDAIDALKEEISDLKCRLSLQEESLVHSRQSVKELEDSIEVIKIDTEKALNQSRDQQPKLKELVESLKQEREDSLATIEKLSFERDNLVAYIDGAYEQFGEFCKEDAKLEGMLANLLQSSENNAAVTSHDASMDKFCNSGHKDVKKEAEVSHNRSPLREINH